MLDHVEQHKRCQKDASIIEHVCHHSSCNLCLHGRTCPSWVLIVCRQHVEQTPPKLCWTLAQLGGHNYATPDVLFLPNPTFCLLLSFEASSALNARQPQLVFWDARVLDHVEKHKWCQKEASIIKHVCHHSSCNLYLHGRTCPSWVLISMFSTDSSRSSSESLHNW